VGPARAAAGKGQKLVVAEGYMDVIALASYGFEAAVAPLGTAITENQLHMLWRIASEPVIALDGDTAGLRAAMRLIDLALPLLEAGKSLRFAIMPTGKDPDDLLRESGAGALDKLLDEAIPMVKLLWRRETEGLVFDSPERKAALEKGLREKTNLISDPTIRSHYEQELKDLRWQLFRQKPQASGAWNKTRGATGSFAHRALSSTKASVLAMAQDEAVTEHMREGVILVALATCPEVIEAFESDLERMRCSDMMHQGLRDILLRNMNATADDIAVEIGGQLGVEALEKLKQQRHIAIVPCIRQPGEPEKVALTVAGELAKLNTARGLNAEIAEAVEDLGGLADEGLTWRLTEAVKAAEKAQRSGQEDREEYEVGENGARISRNEKNALDSLLEAIKTQKPHA
jgi:DNA primase